MFIIRWILGRIILLVDFITSPRSPKLTTEEQQRILENTHGIELYQLKACPFCVKVRRAMKREGINLPLVDIKANQGQFREELVREGGKGKVPCLKINQPEGQIEWLYESNDIIDFLRTRAQA